MYINKYVVCQVVVSIMKKLRWTKRRREGSGHLSRNLKEMGSQVMGTPKGITQSRKKEVSAKKYSNVEHACMVKLNE